MCGLLLKQYIKKNFKKSKMTNSFETIKTFTYSFKLEASHWTSLNRRDKLVILMTS